MSLKQEILRYSRQEDLVLSSWFESKLEQLIDQQVYQDVNALEDTGQKIVAALRNYKKQYRVDTAVIGMSGGVDSALTAALFKAADWDVKARVLPIHQNPRETKRGIEACSVLGLDWQQIELSSTFDNLLGNFQRHDDSLISSKEKLRQGNLRVRLRMMTLYNEASKHKGLVASTDNFSELAAGFWTLHGDVGDLAPIQSLNKSWEVPKLAEIYNVPVSTVFAKPTDGLGISDGDEDQFGFSYLEFDVVLLTLCGEIVVNRNKALEKLNPPKQDLDKVNRILDRIRNSAFKRKNPYNIEHPLQDNRYTGLMELDRALWRQDVR